MLRKFTFAVVVLVLAVSAASADFIQNTYSIGSTDTFSGWTSTFTVPKFNPNLGTLTSLQLTFSGGLTGTLTEYNSTTDGTLLGSANFSNTMTLRRPDNTLLLSFKPLVGRASTLGPTSRRRARRSTIPPLERTRRCSRALGLWCCR
jgi:opacity protein-like surface antigen